MVECILTWIHEQYLVVCNIAKWTILCIVVHFQPVIKLLQRVSECITDVWFWCKNAKTFLGRGHGASILTPPILKFCLRYCHYLTLNISETAWDTNRDAPYSRVLFRMTSSFLAKYSLTWSIERFLCDIWACYLIPMHELQTFILQVTCFTLWTWSSKIIFLLLDVCVKLVSRLVITMLHWKQCVYNFRHYRPSSTIYFLHKHDQHSVPFEVTNLLNNNKSEQN